MWEFPKAVSLVAGAGEAVTELNAFDRALMDAGIANLNFIRVSSIMPPGARVVPLPRLYPGMLVPAVYAQIVSHTPGERIAAALGIGICRDEYGVIMEYSHMGAAENAEAIVRRMVEDAFRMRDLRLDEVHVAAREHLVERTGCVVAVALMWPDVNGAPPKGAGR
jgi:arginine decarboxylase